MRPQKELEDARNCCKCQNEGKVNEGGMRKGFHTCNQRQPGGVAAAAAAEAQDDGDAALSAWCTRPRSCLLASSSSDPSAQWRWGGVNASSLASAHSAPGSTKLHQCCCSCSLLLQTRFMSVSELFLFTDDSRLTHIIIITISHPRVVSFCWQRLAWTSCSWRWTLDCWSHWWPTWCRHRHHIAGSSCMRWAAASSPLAAGPSETSWIAPDTCDCRGGRMTTGAIRTFSEFLIRTQLLTHVNTRLMAPAYTVLLSCLISLLENSLRTSKKARLRGGPPSPWGLGSLKANSMPSLKQIQHEKKHESHESKSVRVSCVQSYVNLVTYLCNMAIASLVFNWSKPNVSEKRRASSLMPQKADDERSTLMPSSDSISLNNYKREEDSNHIAGDFINGKSWSEIEHNCCQIKKKNLNKVMKSSFS